MGDPNDEVVGMFENKRNGALLALSQTFRNVKQFIRADMACIFWLCVFEIVQKTSCILPFLLDIYNCLLASSKVALFKQSI